MSQFRNRALRRLGVSVLAVSLLSLGAAPPLQAQPPTPSTASTRAAAEPSVVSATASQPAASHATTSRAARPKAAGPKAAGPNFLGTAYLFSCSAALVRWPSSQPTDLAMVLTNGHCYQASDKQRVDHEVIVNRRDTRPVTFLKRDGTDRVTLRAARVLYSTAFRTDVGLYRMRLTYAQLKNRFQVPALTISDHAPQPSARVLIPSGYWKRVYSCSLNGFVYRLHNDTFDWRDSLRYVNQPRCRTIGGTSGSPVINPRTRTVVGINNAVNVAAQGSPACSFTLCEQTAGGVNKQFPHRRYGQQTWWLTTCVGPNRGINLALPGCLLPKPPA